MASRSVVPRFLLPLQGPLWRRLRLAPAPAVDIRYLASAADLPTSTKPKAKAKAKTAGAISAAASDDGKPRVLEKPARFNPPSHGSAARRSSSLPKHYGPRLSAVERAAQDTRNYPGLMAPEGTWAHWFWHSRLLHTFITMGTLLLLGIVTFFMNYAYNSPFRDLVPPISDLWRRPADFVTAWRTVIIFHEQDKSRKVQQKRTHKLDDSAKRQYFMKVHGIEPKDPVSMLFGKQTTKSEAELEAAALGLEPPPQSPDAEAEAEGSKSARTKKWFGLF